MKTMTVTGTGRLTLRPDTIRLTLTLSGVEREYDAALARSSDETTQLIHALETVGILRHELETRNFGIHTEYEGFEENGAWKQRLAGYRFLHTMCLEFDADNERLGEILTALADCPASAEIQIGYTVADPEAARNMLLGRAVADAGKKADALAEAAGVTLRGIQSIRYGAPEPDFEVRLMDVQALPTASKARMNMDIVPEDVDLTDTVTVVWEIA